MSNQQHIMTATSARANLFRLMETVAEEHTPVFITGKNTSSVLISESDWRDIEETLYLTSMPEVAASIRKGMQTPEDKCSKDLDW